MRAFVRACMRACLCMRACVSDGVHMLQVVDVGSFKLGFPDSGMLSSGLATKCTGSNLKMTRQKKTHSKYYNILIEI